MIALTEKNGEARIDSRLIADALGIQHKNTWELIKRYKAQLSTWGKVPFQTEALPSGQRTRFALLNENQCHFLLTLSKNTPRVVELKAKLVTAFSEARRKAAVRPEYLPTYHQLHQALMGKGRDEQHQRFLHLNINRLINKAAGIEGGQRKTAPVPSLARAIVAQDLVARVVSDAADDRQAYAQAKAAVQPLLVRQEVLQ